MEARPKPAYAHGAVSEIDGGLLSNLLDELHTEFPISYAHRTLMRELGSEFVFAMPLQREKTAFRPWLVLLRFGAVLESRFGFTREIPVVYSPFSDLQIRSIDSLEKHIGQLPSDRRSVSSSEVLIWAPDSTLGSKLENWSLPSRVLLPLPDLASLEGPQGLQDFINLLAGKLASRDLYSVRGYVTGEQFFGRSGELQLVTDCIRSQEVVGVFGLRKTGKTSLLHQLIRSHDSDMGSNSRRTVLVYQDLEYLPSLAEDPVPELIQDMAENIRRRLKSFGLRTQELARLSNQATPSEFRRTLDALLEDLRDEAAIVLVLDEIEYLCPPDPGTDTSGDGFQRVRQLFGGLRKVVQERDNFGFVLAGLASSSIEAAELYGAPNPLFSFARAMYLRPFSLDEAADMLNSVGKKVSLYWTPAAIEQAHESTGGHALLLRELASAVLSDQRHARSNIVQIRPGHVGRVIPQWKRNVASHVRDVLPHLRRYYDEEADLAVLLIEDPESFSEFASAYPDSVFRLEQLGIIEGSGNGTWKPSRLLEFSYSFESRPLMATSSSNDNPGSRPLDELVAAEESETLEKKESLRAHGDVIPDEKIVDQVLKACLGFLNRRGGTVLVGVADDHEVIGIDRDLEICGGLDRLSLFVTDKVRTKIGDVGVDLIQVTAPTHESALVLRLDVRPAPDPVFTLKAVDGKTGLYVRNNNMTQLFNDKQAMDYIQRHWSRR